MIAGLSRPTRNPGEHMDILRTGLVAGLVLAHAGAWARNDPLPLPVAETLAVEVYFDQPELAVFLPRERVAMATSDGLLPTLLVMGLESKAERKGASEIAPVRDRLIDYGFKEAFAPVLRARLASPGLSPSPQLTWSRSTIVSKTEASQMPPQAMVLLPYFAMDRNFEQLFVRLDAQLVDRTVLPNGALKVEERISRRYEFAFLLPADMEASPANWAALGAGKLAALLEQAGSQVMDMLAYDFSAQGRAQWDARIRGTDTVLDDEQFDGREERRGEHWVWVRTENDGVAGVRGYQRMTPEMITALGTGSGSAGTLP